MYILTRERSALGTLCPPLKPFRLSFGRAIRFLRESARLTQEQLWEKSGVHPRLEHGQGNPTLETVERLAEGLGCSCSHIFALTEIFEREQGELS